jgi:hypothetical protein
MWFSSSRLGPGLNCPNSSKFFSRREKFKRRKPRGERTDAEHWDGPTRTSDEGPVMGLE